MKLPATVRNIYHGSNGDQTKALYERLATLGPVGEVALNLFRACKNSERAKVYRGRRYRGAAYDRKSWAVENVCTVLETHASSLGIVWGWQRDDSTPGFEWVLYVDILFGQVSFHAPSRGIGPDYLNSWDGEKGASPERVIRWCESLLTPEKCLAVAPRIIGIFQDVRCDRDQGHDGMHRGYVAQIDDNVFWVGGAID